MFVHFVRFRRVDQTRYSSAPYIERKKKKKYSVILNFYKAWKKRIKLPWSTSTNNGYFLSRWNSKRQFLKNQLTWHVFKIYIFECNCRFFKRNFKFWCLDLVLQRKQFQSIKHKLIVAKFIFLLVYRKIK